MTSEHEGEAPISRDRRAFMKKAVAKTVAASLLFLVPATPAWPGEEANSGGRVQGRPRRCLFVVDIAACIGCGSCCLADTLAYRVPEGRCRTWVEKFDVDSAGGVSIELAPPPFPPEGEARSIPRRPAQEVFFVPRLCRMCEEPACLKACPTGATFRSADGFVLIDRSRCAGCSSCVAACPHSARFLNPNTGKAEKCSWCHDRLRQGLPPACVAACPVQARRILLVEVGPGMLPVSRQVPERAENLDRSRLLYLGWRKEAV